MSEDGEFTENSDREERSEEEDSQEEGDVVTSLFDALAAAQEASEKYRALEEGEPREDHRLPDEYLITTYNSCINYRWESSVQPKPNKEEELLYKKGYLCEAVWPGDSEWYPAKVIRLKEWKKSYIVRYRGFDKEDEEEVREEDIRPRIRKRKKGKHRGKKKKKLKTNAACAQESGTDDLKSSEIESQETDEDDICVNKVEMAYG